MRGISHRRIGAKRNFLSAAQRLIAFGGYYLSHNNLDAAQNAYTNALVTYRRVGDLRNLADCLFARGYIALLRMDFASARRAFNEAAPLYYNVKYEPGETWCHRLLHELKDEALLVRTLQIAIILPEEIQEQVLRLRHGEALDAFNTDDYDDIVEDATEYHAVVANALKKGLSLAELEEAIEEKLAAKAKATTRKTTGRAMTEPRPDAPAPPENPPPTQGIEAASGGKKARIDNVSPPNIARTAQELFGVSSSSKARRYHRSKEPEFSAAELEDPMLLHAADKVVNDRTKRTKNGEVLSPEELEVAQRAARFVKQARKRRRELGLP